MKGAGRFTQIDGRFHFIGIGGAGMSVVAELLVNRGACVSGSDRCASALLRRLEGLGIEVHVGHDARNVPSDATVVVSTAIQESNPELACARQRGQSVLHRSQALALAASGMRFIGVAGAHGKTTTSGMLAVALREAGEDPSVAVGGIVPQFGSGAYLGSGDFFVAEADESDGSFLNYSPSIEIVTNVEPDHLDRYEDAGAFEEIFLDFSRRLTPQGVLVCCAEDPGAARLAVAARKEGRRVLSYGRPAKCAGAVDVQIVDVVSSAKGVSATVRSSAAQVRLELAVPGVHNILNATAAWIAGVECGVAPEEMARALAAFTGTSRRFEWRGAVGERRVFDDYAHHPTEVSAAIAQARLVAGEGEVVVLFQPHLFSRTRFFAAAFARALSEADHVVLTDIYAAREEPEEGVSAALISDGIEGARFVPNMYDAARVAARLCPADGLLVTMGAGSVTECAEVVLDEWRTGAGDQ